jgi:hypothetical protein
MYCAHLRKNHTIVGHRNFEKTVQNKRYKTKGTKQKGHGAFSG